MVRIVTTTINQGYIFQLHPHKLDMGKCSFELSISMNCEKTISLRNRSFLINAMKYNSNTNISTVSNVTNHLPLCYLL